MRILQVYNQYRTWGGEDTVALLEAELLREHSHEVDRLLVSTKELDGASFVKLAAAGLGTVWSFRGYSAMKKAISSFSPDIIHVHNTFPLLSPSVYWAASRMGVPVVQTLHNYRLTCANSILLRNERPCEACVGRIPWQGLGHRCFGGAFFRTLAVTAKNVLHRVIGTFRRKVHAYIVLTPFSREIMVRAGLPRDRIHVKPNFSDDTEIKLTPRLSQVVFAGSVVRAKGVHLLLEAWSKLPPNKYKLIILGEGADRESLHKQYASNASIAWTGALPRKEVVDVIASSRWLVAPSLSYENFPMCLLEAFSAGTPVLVPNHGSFTAIVSDKQEGLYFSAGDTSSLAGTLQMALSMETSEWTRFSIAARSKFLREYTGSTNYHQLMAIYSEAAACQRQLSSRERIQSQKVTGPAGIL